METFELVISEFGFSAFHPVHRRQKSFDQDLNRGFWAALRKTFFDGSQDSFTVLGMKGSPSTSEFTQRLREALKTSGQSIGNIAKAAGLGGRQSLHPYLTGRVEPTLRRVEQLAKVLHVDRRWLAGWQDKGGPIEPRRPLSDGEWQQAITALYRHAARQALGDLPSDPKGRRALLRRSAKLAGYAAYCGYRYLEKPDGWESDFPIRKRCYKINKLIFLNAANGEVARICVYTGREGGTRMRVISSRD